MRKILITNDDGINADGLVRLARAAAEFGEVWVVAPDSQRSAMSHSVTLRHPIEAWQVDFQVPGVRAYACDGQPADCVRIGVLNIVPGKPDHVLSGINYGYNLASDLQYSATAGAAFEAAFQKIHSIAFSEDAGDIHEVTDRYLKGIPADSRIRTAGAAPCARSDLECELPRLQIVGMSGDPSGQARGQGRVF